LPPEDVWFDDEESDGDDAEYVEYERPEQRMPEWFEVYAKLNRKLASFSVYWEVFDPYQHLSSSGGKQEHIIATLPDDLAEIYSEGHWIAAYERGGIRDIYETAWHWRFASDSLIIGEHLTGAMRAIRCLIYDHSELWEAPDQYWEPLA